MQAMMSLMPQLAPVGHCRRPSRAATLSAKRVVKANAQKLCVEPTQNTSTAFAPATVANLGPGFDCLGVAVQGSGDTVVAKVIPNAPGQLVIERIEGDNGRLSLDPAKNCIGVAAAETLRLIGPTSCGVSLTLYKGLPLGSGLGSSAASAAAAAYAVNGLFGSPLTKDTLLIAGLAAEASVSGYHADNVGPSLLGGFVLIRNCTPGQTTQLVRLPLGASASGLHFVLVNPVFEAPTAKMRAALPNEVSRKAMVKNCSEGNCLVAGILMGDIQLLGTALDSDVIVEPVRAPLIPGMLAVKEAAKAAGAYGCTISGSGPTAVAVVGDPETGERVAAAMAAAFKTHGKLDVNTAKVVRPDLLGAKFV